MMGAGTTKQHNQGQNNLKLFMNIVVHNKTCPQFREILWVSSRWNKTSKSKLWVLQNSSPSRSLAKGLGAGGGVAVLHSWGWSYDLESGAFISFLTRHNVCQIYYSCWVVFYSICAELIKLKYCRIMYSLLCLCKPPCKLSCWKVAYAYF